MQHRPEIFQGLPGPMDGSNCRQSTIHLSDAETTAGIFGYGCS